MISRNRRIAEESWRFVLAVTVITAMTVGLATRFSSPPSSQLPNSKLVISRSTEPQRQHFNSDAIRWLRPVASTSLFKLITFHVRIAPADPLIPDHLFAPALYNRPPPFVPSL
jgi:hypothetical protein